MIDKKSSILDDIEVAFFRAFELKRTKLQMPFVSKGLQITTIS